MKSMSFRETASVKQSAHLLRLCRVLCVFSLLLLTPFGGAQVESTEKAGSDPIPQAAAPAILAAFDKYEVVGIPEAHGLKDLDDFILSLIRTPAFAEKVNDIEIECGNSLYQPLLDRYIAGEDVSFTEVRKVWRNTAAGAMCSTSAFFEQFFPLVRAINQKLPVGKRLRVLAGDAPIDWDQVKSFQDVNSFVFSRDDTIASVMEKEVLSKHRKALMLFGTLHLMHGVGRLSAVSIYEKDYPNVTFVVGELGAFDTNLPTLSSSRFASWPIPSLARTRGSWLGGLDFAKFQPPMVFVDMDCNPHGGLPKELQKPSADLIDAFLYLGPQDLRLKEQVPAQIALDTDYIREMLRRESALPGFPGSPETVKDFEQQILSGAVNPLFIVPKQPDAKAAMQSCLGRKAAKNPPHSQ
jgi:hypothetical protein